MTDEDIDTITEAANILRGMTMDPRIPADTKDVMRRMINNLEAMVEDQENAHDR